MEKISIEKDKKEASLFKIRIGVESTEEKIKEILSREHYVQFIVTDGFDIWLTTSGHTALAAKNNLEWNNMGRGYFYIEDGNLILNFYEDIDNENKKQIKDKIKEFCADNLKMEIEL